MGILEQTKTPFRRAFAFSTPALKTLAKHKIEVWVSSVSEGSPLAIRYLNLLSGPEMRRMRQMGESRNGFLVSRALLRRALSRHSPALRPQDWSFVRKPSGEWELPGTQNNGMGFCTSRTGAAVAVAISGGVGVGVDIEPIHQENWYPIDAALSPEEQLTLQHPSAQQQAKTLRIWTAKEAVTKLSKLGAELDPQSFHVSSEDLQICYQYEAGQRKHTTLIRTDEIDIDGKTHVLSVAADCPEGALAEVSVHVVRTPDEVHL